MFPTMVSSKAIAILAIFALGSVNAKGNPKSHSADETAHSKKAHPTEVRMIPYSPTTPASQGSQTSASDETAHSKIAHPTEVRMKPYSATTHASQGSQTSASDDDDDCDDDDDETTPSPTTLSTSVVSVTVLTTASSTPTAVSPGGYAPKTCKAVAPPPAGLTCGTEGYISQKDPAGSWPPQKKKNLKECATLCSTGPGCTAFHYREDGNCQIFMNDFSSYGFYPSTTGTYWYQSGCFECSSDDTALDLDFTYADISDWTLTSDDANAFHMDLQTSDGKPSLRILEIYPKGKATIDYLSTFNVEAEATYELVFDVRSSLPVNQHTGLPDTDFSLLTFYITTNGNIIHETIPVNGVWDRGQGWLKFTSHFVVRKEDAGAAKLSFTLHASGVHLDWYLSYLWVRKV